MYLFIYLFIYLSIYLFIYVSIYLFIYLFSIYLFIYLSIYICIIFIYLSIYLFIYLSIYLDDDDDDDDDHDLQVSSYSGLLVSGNKQLKKVWSIESASATEISLACLKNPLSFLFCCFNSIQTNADVLEKCLAWAEKDGYRLHMTSNTTIFFSTDSRSIACAIKLGMINYSTKL